MPQGIEVRDANGNVIVNIDSRLARYISVVNTGTSNGSVSVANSVVLPTVASEPVAGQPQLSVAGGTVSWSFGNLESSRRVAADVQILAF